VTTFLSGQVNDITKLIHQSKESENLYILPAGPVPPNPNELLLSDNMSRMMDQLRNDFDYVILDTAPIGVISDSFLIIPHSDIQLYVSRAGYSTKSCLKVLHQAVRDNRLHDPYIVLNGVDITSNSYTYRKYGHYYHTSNGSDTPRRTTRKRKNNDTSNLIKTSGGTNLFASPLVYFMFC
jgi:capsular exopolysaccharide synthesis family protein